MICKVKGYFFFYLPILVPNNPHCMSSPSCLNCNTTLDQSSRFCPVCGQKTDTHRLSFKHIIHDFFHAFTHADKSIFGLLRDLAIKPGIVAKEYIAGKRKKYFNPFTFFLILAGLFVLSNKYFTSESTPAKPDGEILARMPGQAARDQYVMMFTRGAEINGFLTRHSNIVSMFAVPVFGFVTWLFFRRNRYNFAENVTANLLFVSFSNIIFTILIYPLLGQARGNQGAYYSILMMGILLQMIYLSWCYFQFQPNDSRFRLPKAIGLSLLGLFLWQVIYMLVISVYIYRDLNFYKFFVRMFS
ncbi:MAG: DUF3667 domain-containing protein [Chitinophagaceae bacterium]|nr:MAG: DUF3667 domain-containing protein [Chitinophagaceae bacterium]